MTIVKTKLDSVVLLGCNFYKISLTPISSGYSTCLANMIRCILFTSVYGYSVTEVNISGVNSEYDNLLGVKEDVLNIILNLRGIIFKLKTKKVILNLKKNNFCVVKAGDIVLEEGVKILNPWHIIAHLSNNSVLEMKIKVEEGKGYLPLFSKNLKKKREIDGILVDANFSPILRAYYLIEKIKTDLYNDLDKIDFFIETNGSISGKKALLDSIGFLLYQLSDFKIKNKEKKLKKEIKSYSNLDKNLFIELREIEFTLRTWNCIKKLNIFYLGDLVRYTEESLLKIKSLGKKSLDEIKKKLEFYDLYLGTNIENWENILKDYVNDINDNDSEIN